MRWQVPEYSDVKGDAEIGSYRKDDDGGVQPRATNRPRVGEGDPR